MSNSDSCTDVDSYTPGTWYTIKLVADPATDKVDVYVDGILKQSQKSFANAVSAIDTFVTHSTTTDMTMQVDDVLVTI